MKQWIRIEIAVSILLVLGTLFFSVQIGAETPAAKKDAKVAARTAPAARRDAPTVRNAVANDKKAKAATPDAKNVAARKAPAARRNAPAKREAKTKASASATKGKSKKGKKAKAGFFEKLTPILLFLVVVVFILGRLPPPDFGGVDVGWRTSSFLRRRILNWLPLGLTYAFLYMGRYNLKVSKFAFENIAGADGASMMSNQDFGFIFAAGTVVYGFSFLINGPLTDKLGGKFAILIGAAGSCVMNLLMGLASWSLLTKGAMSTFLAANFVLVFSVLYAVNMYFQSFGAVAIVKVNAHWFHVRERGVFGAIFGILISLGIYFAFDLGYMILKGPGLIWVFLIPAILLAIFWVLDFMFVEDTPGEAGLEDFDTADASSGDDGPQLGAVEVFKLMMKNPIVITIALIEFCSGFLRQAIMQWYRTFAKQTDAILHLKDSFVYDNWGMLLCIAGISGGVLAGIISDRMFQSRRGPVAGLLYGVMAVCAIILSFTYTNPAVVGILVIVMSMAVIGVHGMLSGTASMDFGGKKNVGIAVGIIDGFVYLGTAVMSLTYAIILPKEGKLVGGKIVGAATQPENWIGWPVAMIPLAVIGFLLALRVWNAKPKGKEKPATES
ncbi:MAG: MFS transporter [Deltaproteobacteria bacterium]|nr:MFS transporter [Deltaproteobacteria bacterium]|tara:strand:+ start:10101 stop:11933 length:1833 start_codon:yes stop_codon:yes gene_type:complete